MFEKLRSVVMDGVARWDSLRHENKIPVVYNSQDLLPKFVDIGRLSYEVMEDLLPLHEQWAGGIRLRGTSAYGVRLYQNGSSLGMHCDKVLLI